MLPLRLLNIRAIDFDSLTDHYMNDKKMRDDHNTSLKFGDNFCELHHLTTITYIFQAILFVLDTTKCMQRVSRSLKYV